MTRPQTLPAFTPDELPTVQRLLALAVVRMMGRKLEEADWADVYCAAKGIPVAGWSNLNIDVMHEALGVEHKMLCTKSATPLEEAFGTRRMHPSLTRSIRINAEGDADTEMRSVFDQYAALIESRRAKVRAQAAGVVEPDMRIGWLLWQTSLRQFLYFEQEMLAPNPEEYSARWQVTPARGDRKESKSLWIFERESGDKRYSVTTSAGAKIQPYFDVPPPTDPNVYLFTVIGEQIDVGGVRVWITRDTASALSDLAGSLHTDAVSDLILAAVDRLAGEPDVAPDDEPEIVELIVREDAYVALVDRLVGVNDDHRFQLLLAALR